jgi:hypothetical protein
MLPHQVKNTVIRRPKALVPVTPMDVNADGLELNEYLGITVHWFTQDFQVHSILLNMKPLTPGKIGNHLACIFERSLHAFVLCPRVSHITTDNGSDMLGMVHLLALQIPNFDATQNGLR